MAMLRIANPSISVRLRVAPPLYVLVHDCGKTHLARVVELVDTRDLKSLAGNSVPVQVRPRVPSIDDKKASTYVEAFLFVYIKKINGLSHFIALIDRLITTRLYNSFLSQLNKGNRPGA